MRRFSFLAISVLALLALAAPVVDARQNGHHNGHSKTAAFSAKTSHAPQGGALKVVAKVKHPRHGASFSATATVHFASGDQTVQLKRHGKSFVASAKVTVSGDETPGAVPVDVTFEYDESEQEVETEGTVEQGDAEYADNGDDQGDDQACDPATTTCDDQGDDQTDDNDGDQTCDPATSTCSDQDQDGDDGDDNGGGSDD